MPRDPELLRAAKRRWYHAKYASAEFREAEAERKAAWLAEVGAASNAAASARYRARARYAQSPLPEIARGQSES